MRMRHSLLIGLTLLPSLAFAACPPGTENVIGSNGLPNCISATPKDTPKAPRFETCPVGSVRYADFDGKTVCRRLDTGQELMNFQVSCPLGTFPATDVGGNRVCQKR